MSKPEISPEILLEFWKKEKIGSCTFRPEDLPLNPLRWGWVLLERTQILSGIQFTTHFNEFFFVETKRFVGSIVHVILTRQTCGQRSRRAAESKRRALGNYFSERICYVFLIWKCWGKWKQYLTWIRSNSDSGVRKKDRGCHLPCAHARYRTT